MNNAKILITGGAGFIASCLAEKLLNLGNKVTLVDNFVTGFETNLPIHPNSVFFEIDVNQIKEIEPVFSENKFDYVFHFAALVGVQRTLDNPLMVLNDIEGFKNILELSKTNGVKKVFFSSSSEVYGEPV